MEGDTKQCILKLKYHPWTEATGSDLSDWQDRSIGPVYP